MRILNVSVGSLMAAGLVAGSALAVAAQPADEYPPLVHFTGSAGSPGHVNEPTVTEGDLGFEMTGLEVYDVPFEMSDPRISGVLSYFGQGRGGGPIGEDGFVNYDSYSLRIDNADGAWEGQGRFFWVGQGEEELVNTETMVLTGSGAYEGKYAYIVADWLDEPPVHGIITSLEPAGFPAPVPPPTE